jgi:hypothetical protein
MSDSLIQFPAMASGASFAGTCLMQTMIFTEYSLLKLATKTHSQAASVERPGKI